MVPIYSDESKLRTFREPFQGQTSCYDFHGKFNNADVLKYNSNLSLTIFQETELDIVSIFEGKLVMHEFQHMLLAKLIKIYMTSGINLLVCFDKYSQVPL